MGKIAFVFAGQGAQYQGMGKSLAEISPAARAVFDMAERIRPGTREQCTQAAKEEMSVTVNTQPCLFCVDLMAARALEERGVRADMAAGFSLGEIPALAFAGYMTDEQAFRFVVRRGEVMDACAGENPGRMFAVVKLSAGDVEALCRAIPECWPVNYNCPGQTVVACAAASAAALTEAVKNAGGRALPLAVSGAFHSPYMKAATEALAAEFAQLAFAQAPVPVYANVTAQPYDAEELLFRQVSSPVLWQRTIEAMLKDGADTFVEVGPGKTLSGLIAKIAPDARICRVEDEKSLNETMEVLSSAEK